LLDQNASATSSIALIAPGKPRSGESLATNAPRAAQAPFRRLRPVLFQNIHMDIARRIGTLFPFAQELPS
jgi:hypothetical protein